MISSKKFKMLEEVVTFLVDRSYAIELGNEEREKNINDLIKKQQELELQVLKLTERVEELERQDAARETYFKNAQEKNTKIWEDIQAVQDYSIDDAVKEIMTNGR